MSIRHPLPVDLFDLYSSSILQNLPDEDAQLLQRNAVPFTFKKGQVLYREGSYPTGVFHIRSGRVKKYKMNGTGREQIICVCSTDDIMGFQAILREERHFSSAAAMTDAEILFIPREDFLELVERSRVFTQRLLKSLSHQFDVLANSIFIHAQYPVKDRLIFALLMLNEKFKNGSAADGHPVDISISRSDLANMVGTSRETVVRLLKEMKESNIINTKGAKISLLDTKALFNLFNY